MNSITLLIGAIIMCFTGGIINDKGFIAGGLVLMWIGISIVCGKG